MILFSISDKGFIIPYTVGNTAYTYDDNDDMTGDLILSSMALYRYLRGEIDRLEALINNLGRIILDRKEAEDLRREPGWESWMPSDLSN